MGKRDVNAFRERFQKWKSGELVYDKGRPVAYSYGKEDDALPEYPILPVSNGDKVDTDQCATWSNGWLRDNGYLTYGNAWNLKNVDTLYNGYRGIEKPSIYDKTSIEQYNHAAADSLYKNFDSNILDRSKPYAVNMFYNDSPAQEEAYNKGAGVTGTHTGILTFNPVANRWYVTHNIHGTIHQEPFVPLLSGKGKYGVTAIYQPRKNTIVNKVKGLFGFKDGKDSNRYNHPETFLGSVTRAITGSAKAGRTADITSATALLFPQGMFLSALDFGRDANRAFHGENGAKLDMVLDVAAMLPFVSKLGLKTIRAKSFMDALKLAYNRSLQSVRTPINAMISSAIGADYVDDTLGADQTTYKNGKDSGIYIKPSHRGRLTALKKRTGKSEAELWKTGGPAVRKMITFARNARKWKH